MEREKNHAGRRGKQYKIKKKAKREQMIRDSRLLETPVLNTANPSDFCPCKWASYGCTERVKHESTHSDTCTFRYDEEIQKTLEKLSIYNTDPSIIEVVSEALKKTGCRYAAVEKYDKITPATRRDLPFMFPSSECWETCGAPRPGDLDRHVLSSQPDASKDLTGILTILSQLHHQDHSPTDVRFILNLKPAKILESYPLVLPTWISNLWTDHIGDIAMNVTPTFSVVDVHCDRGLSTVSMSLGPQVKLWALWEPTEYNLEVFFNAKEQSSRLGQKCYPNIAHLLKGGQMIVADQSVALYVPAGWLHLVYTICGGYLTGYTFVGIEDLRISVDCLVKEINVCANVKDLKETIRFLIMVLGRQLVLLDKQMVYDATQQWIRMITAMSTAAKERGLIWTMTNEIKTALCTFAKANPMDLGRDCPCGEAGSGKRFFEHLKKKHCL